MNDSTQKSRENLPELDLGKIPREVTEWDERAFARITGVEISDTLHRSLIQPEFTDPKQREILAVHWHPEHVPVDIAIRRMRAMFPNALESLIIPTQHNHLLELGGFAGVEVDCYSNSFKRKVQLLVHFEESRVQGADTFLGMLDHTFKYRRTQLTEYLDTALNPDLEQRLQEAAEVTGVDDTVIEFVRIYMDKLKRMVEAHEQRVDPQMIRNKIVREYLFTLMDLYDSRFINRVQLFMKVVKGIVKRYFNFDYFYETREVLEEVRGLGGCVVVPHPEQFWPILLADYDVDGYEVWNPQSRQYTEFLVDVVIKQNKTRARSERPLMIFMGDDTHMGEKLKDPRFQDQSKSGREVGLQPPWDDLAIGKRLIAGGFARERVILDYRERLVG